MTPAPGGQPRPPAPGASAGRASWPERRDNSQPRTNTEHEVVVRLVVDLIQDVEHLNGKICQCAEVGGDGLLSLDVSRHGLLRLTGARAEGSGTLSQ